MSATIQNTDRAVAAAQTVAELATAAEASPVVKADLQNMFDSYSHSPVVMGLVAVIGPLLAQKNITVDSTLLTVGLGLIVTGVGYGWQWISMKINKPGPVPAA